jgi:hypothetical protein
MLLQVIHPVHMCTMIAHYLTLLQMMQELKFELTADSYSLIPNNIPPRSACSFGLSGNISTSMLAPSSASSSFASFDSWQIFAMAATLCNTRHQ